VATVLGIGIEPLQDGGGRYHFHLQDDDQAQDSFPLRFDEYPVKWAAQSQGEVRPVGYVHSDKGVELLVLEGLQAWGVGDAQQGVQGEVDFREPMRVGAVNGGFDYVIV
jgi:hypothetical protein